MPILESIQNSEKNAEKIRENAKKDVEALMQKTNEENQILETNILNKAKEEVKSIKQKADLTLKQVEKELEKQQLEANELDRKKATSKMSKAVDYIIDKVINI